jgi:hypothetical protein
MCISKETLFPTFKVPLDLKYGFQGMFGGGDFLQS